MSDEATFEEEVVNAVEAIYQTLDWMREMANDATIHTRKAILAGIDAQMEYLQEAMEEMDKLL